MYTLMKTFNLKLLKTEAPLFFFALFIAESFYHFHSFMLELFAFLGTWYLLSYAISHVLKDENEKVR